MALCSPTDWGYNNFQVTLRVARWFIFKLKIAIWVSSEFTSERKMLVHFITIRNNL
jgi:hypothetical protein